MAIHGNTQNGQIARADWEPIVGESSEWQIETVQSAEPDGYGTYRWSYDMTSYLPVAHSMEKVQKQGYQKLPAAVFLPDAICFCVQLHLHQRVVIC